ncbi:MAG: Abi family protein [Chitinophagales bacterium]|nr:Abi family protein [Chitinophagales bacterium]
MQYRKPSLAITDQIRLLQSRGLNIPDIQKAEHYLSHISYYRLRAYTYPLQNNANPNHPFLPNVEFEHVLDLYRFDRRLRIIVFDAIERIEIAFRTQIIYHFSQAHGAHFFENGRLYHNQVNFRNDLKSLDKEIRRSSETFIKHYKRKYTQPKRPAAWMSLEVTSMGLLSKIYQNLAISAEKKQVSAHFGLNPFVLESWMHALSHARNICAHHSRLWNRTLTQTAKLPKHTGFLWISLPPSMPDRVYTILSCIQYLLNIIAPRHTFSIRLKELLAEYPAISVRDMGFPNNWEQDPFWA